MRRKKVLLADDSPTVIKMLTAMLANLPCDVLVAVDGVEAIELSYKTHPDLILLDILMPKMNGYQVCRLLKDDEATRPIPVIMLTAKDQQADKFWGLATGADDYIVKDFEDVKLFDIITRILQQDTSHIRMDFAETVRDITTIDVLSHANNLLDRQLYQSTITNRINQLARSIQNFGETIESVFDLFSCIITYQIGAISVMGTRSARVRLYVYIMERVSARMFEQIKTSALQEFSELISIRTIETHILHGEVNPETDEELLSVCQSPLIGRDKKIGWFVLGDARKNKFSDNDQELIRTSSTEVAVVIDNARLYDANARIYADLERELRTAYDLQKRMLPQDNPMEAMFNIEATSLPAKEVGGDYYDYFPISDHQLLVAIGDVTGKGVPAALMMAMIKTALRIRAEFTHDVRALMDALNTLIYNQASRQYMTLFLGILDVKARTITYCSAGHNFPYVISADRTLRHLEMSALPLGFLQNAHYRSQTQSLQETDILFFYTDGIVEAMNDQREFFGYPRLEQLLLEYCHESLVNLHLKILERIETFCHDTPQDDDMTMLFVQCKHAWSGD